MFSHSNTARFFCVLIAALIYSLSLAGVASAQTGNTSLGTDALAHNTTGIDNTAIGAFANVSTGNLFNATAIGHGAIVMGKIRGFELTSWNFIGHDPKEFRHYGPMAQDFFVAFGHDGVGQIGSETTINSGDLAGILMIAVQALEKRTAELKQKEAQFAVLQSEVKDLTRISHNGIISRGCKRRECFHLDDTGGSALLSWRQTGNWTPMAAIRLCTSQCPIRRRSYSLVADSADNPQISAA